MVVSSFFRLPSQIFGNVSHTNRHRLSRFSVLPKTDGIDFPSGVWQNESQWEYSALVIKKTEQQSSLVRPQCHLTAQLRDSGEHTRAQVIVARRHGPSGGCEQARRCAVMVSGTERYQLCLSTDKIRKVSLRQHTRQMQARCC